MLIFCLPSITNKRGLPITQLARKRKILN